MQVISSKDNEQIKYIKKLKDKKFRDETNDISLDKKIEQIDRLTKSYRRDDEMVKIYGEQVVDKINLGKVILDIQNNETNYSLIEFNVIEDRMNNILEELNIIEEKERERNNEHLNQVETNDYKDDEDDYEEDEVDDVENDSYYNEDNENNEDDYI